MNGLRKRRRRWYGVAIGAMLMSFCAVTPPVLAEDPPCPPPCLEDNPHYNPNDSSSERCNKPMAPLMGNRARSVSRV